MIDARARSALLLVLVGMYAPGCSDVHSNRIGLDNPESTAVRGPMLSRARSKPVDSITPGIITAQEILALLARESELYWGIRGLATGERRTGGGGALVSLDTARLATLKDVRTWFASVYTKAATDTVLADFGMVEERGRVWMIEADGGDLSDHTRSKLLELRPDGAEHLVAVVLVPLEDTDDAEERVVRLERTSAGWRIESVRTRTS